MPSSLRENNLTQVSKYSKISNKATKEPLGNSKAYTNKVHEAPIAPAQREANPIYLGNEGLSFQYGEFLLSINLIADIIWSRSRTVGQPYVVE
jgi:hypothetical protein